jgi:DNA-binding beta-propeller fold protein YncE
MRAVAPLALILALAPLACSTRDLPPAPTAPEPAAAVNSPPPTSCARSAAAAALAPVDAGGAGSPVALARAGSRTLAFIADEDESAIHTVDLDGRAPLARTPLAGRPAQLIVLSDGRLIASLRDRALLEVLEPSAPSAPLARRCLVPIAEEPVGLAVTPDGAALLAASRWGSALAAFSTADLRRLGAIDLPRDPSAVVASADGRLAFVSHAVGGRVSVVELGENSAPARARELRTDGVEFRHRALSLKEMPLDFEFDGPPRLRKARRLRAVRVERRGSQGFALARASSGAVFAPGVLVDPSPGDGGGYGGAATGTVLGQIAAIDPKGERAEVPPANGALGVLDCLLPRAAAFDPADELLLVACLGLDSVIAYDARAKAPHESELFRRRVGGGPTGLAVDAAGRRAVVFSQFDGAVAMFPIARGRAAAVQGARAGGGERAGGPDPDVVVIPLERAQALDPQIARGRSLFHAASARRIAFDGRACASCHPDGRDDAITWATEEGPRQTPMLLGRLDGTAPYGWEGDKNDLPSHFARTMSRLSGTGLKPEERDALFAYVRSLAPPRERPEISPEERAATLPPPVRTAEAGALRARGEALFHAEDVGCSSCHLGDDATTDGLRHDVRSAARFERVRAFETPSLRFIARSAPYFHDGRYGTLREMLAATSGAMGSTQHLAEGDLNALEEYLLSL